MSLRIELPDDVVLRLVRPDDGGRLAAAYARNRVALEPWEPARPEAFYTAEHQSPLIPVQLLEHRTGRTLPAVLERGDQIVGRVTLSDAVHGVFRNAHLGYWLDVRLTGRGLMTAAVEAVATHARDELGLHRLQASVMPRNAASIAVLRRTGFTRIGLAESYLKIAGRWQDHLLYQRILEPGP